MVKMWSSVHASVHGENVELSASVHGENEDFSAAVVQK
jgi:hypothetical protein